MLSIIKGKLSRPAFETWFTNTMGVIEGNTLLVTAQNDFQRDWLENRYSNDILAATKQITGKELLLQINSISEEYSISDMHGIIQTATHIENIDEVIRQSRQLKSVQTTKSDLKTIENPFELDRLDLLFLFEILVKLQPIYGEQAPRILAKSSLPERLAKNSLDIYQYEEDYWIEHVQNEVEENTINGVNEVREERKNGKKN